MATTQTLSDHNISLIHRELACMSEFVGITALECFAEVAEILNDNVDDYRVRMVRRNGDFKIVWESASYKFPVSEDTVMMDFARALEVATETWS